LYLGGWYWYLRRVWLFSCVSGGIGRRERAVVYLPLGSATFLSAARFHGLNCLFSASPNCGVVSVEFSRSAIAGALPSAACDEAHRIDPAVYVWRASGDRGRLRAGLDNPRRLAMVIRAAELDWSDRHAELRPKLRQFEIRNGGNFLGHCTDTDWGLGLAVGFIRPSTVLS
jgi:hypothetical protein